MSAQVLFEEGDPPLSLPQGLLSSSSAPKREVIVGSDRDRDSDSDSDRQ
jgi:hypothetical protein